MHVTPREAATLCAALESWPEELRDGSDWMQDSNLFARHIPLTVAEAKDLSARLASIVGSASEPQLQRQVEHAQDPCSGNWQLRYKVPVWTPPRAESNSDDVPSARVPILICQASGLRIVLGTHDDGDREHPDILIERRSHGWAVFPHADDSRLCGLYILDEQRALLMVDSSSEVPLEIVDDEPSELDAP